MLVNSILFAIILVLLTKVNRGRAFCKSYDQKSTVAMEQEYWDDYNELTCCETVYPTLYNYIKCNNATLTAGQQLVVDSSTNNAKYIKFEYSKIPLVPIGVFTFTNLFQLYLNNSAVENIHPGAFTGLTNLEYLYLQNNNIFKITRGTLNSLNNLKLLDLSNNNMAVIEEHALLGLFNMLNLNLSHNKLSNLLPDVFDNLNNLENVDLSHNHLIEISPKLFLNLTKLNQLNLSHNNLIDFDFFFLSYALKKLQLDSNQINSLENWSDMPNLLEINLSNNRLANFKIVHTNLKYLNLSRNRIVEINLPLSNNAQKLTTLDLSHNVISNLTQDVFIGLSNLNNLYLQNNLLEYIPVGCFNNLKLLNLLKLSHNQIVEFEFGTFSGLIALETFDISYNKLSYLYESLFHTLRSLKYLNINDNFINTFDPLDLLEHIPSLKNISINNNPWNCKSLLKIVKSFEKMNVSVPQGSTKKSENVHGISCINSNFNKVVSDLNATSLNETLLQLLQNISQELKKLQSVFQKDSQNSSFPNLILKYFDDGFKNTTFYQYFNQDVSNITFFKSFNQTLLKLFQNFELLNVHFQNASLYEFVKNAKLAEEFSKYIKDGFKNNSFNNSVFQFLKYIQNDLKTPNWSHVSNMSDQLNFLNNYFNNGFKNTTFYNFFANKSWNFYQNSSLLEDFVSKKSAIYTDSNIPYDNKISELQTANLINNNLMIVVVIVLVIIMVLIIFSQIKTCFSINNYKNVSTRDNNSKQSNDDVELI